MRFEVGCELGYQVETPATFLLNLHAARLPQQKVIRERFEVTPAVSFQEHVMPESGNRYVRFQAEPGEVRIVYRALVELEARLEDPAEVAEVPVSELPLEVLPHLWPSRYCQSDRLLRAAMSDFGAGEPGHVRVTQVCNWIHDQIAYRRGVSDEHSSATDTLVERAGVCRDFAHLGIALCRALGIPARFVSAYAWKLDPPDFHAVFEAWLGDRWYLFDPTRQAALDGLVRIGVGRDAADVAFASFYGQVTPKEMKVHIAPAGDEEEAPDGSTTAAVSVSKV